MHDTAKTERIAQTIELLGLMVEALAELRRECIPGQLKKFAIFAQGPLEEIRRLALEAQTLASEVIAIGYAAPTRSR